MSAECHQHRHPCNKSECSPVLLRFYPWAQRLGGNVWTFTAIWATLGLWSRKARTDRSSDFSQSFWLWASLEVQVCRFTCCHHVLLCFVRYNNGSGRIATEPWSWEPFKSLYKSHTHGLHNHMDYCACTKAHINNNAHNIAEIILTLHSQLFFQHTSRNCGACMYKEGCE